MLTTPQLHPNAWQGTAGWANEAKPERPGSEMQAQDDAVGIQRSETDNLLQVQVRKFLPSKQFRETFRQLRAYEDRYILFNAKGMKIVAPEDQAWLLNESGLFSELESGRMAVIEPEDLFGKLSLKNILKGLQERYPSLELQVFSSETKATNWLKDAE